MKFRILEYLDDLLFTVAIVEIEPENGSRIVPMSDVYKKASINIDHRNGIFIDIKEDKRLYGFNVNGKYFFHNDESI